MNRVEEMLLESNCITKEDIKKKSIDFSWIYIHFISSLGKSIVILFILLAIGLTTMLSGSIDLTLILTLIGSIWAVVRFKNNFFASSLALSAIFMILLYYTKTTIGAASAAYAFYIGALIYYKNYDAFSMLLPVSYGYISIIYLDTFRFEYRYLLVLITLINFGVLAVTLLNQDRFRKSKFGKSYKLVVVELIFTSLLLSVYYEFDYISLFFRNGEKDYFVYVQNIIYALSNIYLLTQLNMPKRYKVSNGLLLLLSIKVPFIAYVLFVYNLSIYYGWRELKKVAYVFLLAVPFLMYHTFTISFLQKSMVIGGIGLGMLAIYIYLNKVGDGIE